MAPIPFEPWGKIEDTAFCDVKNCPAPECPFECFWYWDMKEKEALLSRLQAAEKIIDLLDDMFALLNFRDDVSPYIRNTIKMKIESYRQKYPKKVE